MGVVLPVRCHGVAGGAICVGDNLTMTAQLASATVSFAALAWMTADIRAVQHQDCGHLRAPVRADEDIG
jgi:hypothetical protein